MKTFSILGGGWLGFALAQKLSPHYHINVSTTTLKKHKEFKSLGFNSFMLTEEDTSCLDEFLECHYLLIAIPPSKFVDYCGFLRKILSCKKTELIKKIIFISSTSAYDNEDGNYDENRVILNPVNSLVYEAEKCLFLDKSVIFRCAGLMGYDRIAGKYFANRIVRDKNSCINYVHRDDVISAIRFAIKKDLIGIYNLCSKNHPTKEEVYIFNSKKYGFEKPLFENVFTSKRIIISDKIREEGFSYFYDSPFEYK